MDLDHKGDDLDFREKCLQHFARDRRGRDAPDCFASAGTASALPVANSVFGLVGKVRVGRTERFPHRFIGFRPRVFISNENCYRSAESFTFEYAGQNFTPIRFLSLSGDSALAGTAAIEFPLNVLIRQINPRWTTIHNDSNSA